MACRPNAIAAAVGSLISVRTSMPERPAQIFVRYRAGPLLFAGIVTTA